MPKTVYTHADIEIVKLLSADIITASVDEDIPEEEQGSWSDWV